MTVRNRVVLACALLLMLLAASLPVTPQATLPVPTAEIDSLLVQLSQAEMRLSFSGVQERTTLYAGKPMLLRWDIYHWQPEKTFIQFRLPDTLRQSAMLIDGRDIRFRGHEHTARVLKHGDARRLLQEGQLLTEIELLKQNYQLAVRDSGLVLDRPARVLDVKPLHPGRPALQVTFDAETGLTLAVQRTAATAGDSLARTTRFVELRYGSPDSAGIDLRFPQEVRPERQGTSEESHSDLAALLTRYRETVLIPEQVPAGFAMRRIRLLQKDERTFVHFLYSDGLTVISLFQRANGDSKYQKQDEKDDGRRRSRSRSLSLIRGSKHGINYSVVGEIAPAELRNMAASLVPIGRKRVMWPYYAIAAAVVLSIFAFLYTKKVRENTDAI